MDFGSQATQSYMYTGAAVLAALIVLKKVLGGSGVKQTSRPFGTWHSDGNLYNSTSVGTIKTVLPGVKTVYDLMAQAIAKGGDDLTAGKRKILKRHWITLPGGKTVEKLELSTSYNYITYNEFGETMNAIGAGMVGLAGLKPRDCVIIYAETAREWMMAAQGAYTQGLTVVTVYAKSSCPPNPLEESAKYLYIK